MHEDNSRRPHYSGEDLVSGAAGLLWLAEQYARETPEVSIIFVAFSGNEQGLKGSSFFINQTEIERDSILAMVSMRETGHPQGDRMTIAGRESKPHWDRRRSTV